MNFHIFLAQLIRSTPAHYTSIDEVKRRFYLLLNGADHFNDLYTSLDLQKVHR